MTSMFPATAEISCSIRVMHPPEVDQVCRELLLASAARERAQLAADAEGARAATVAIQAAVGVLRPHLQTLLGAFARARARLVASARLCAEDLQQHVLQRLIERPPSQTPTHGAALVVFGWARRVALNLLIDHQRKAKRVRLAIPVESDAADEPPASGRNAPDLLGSQQELAGMRRAAESLRRYKYLHETYSVLAEDLDTPAIELAERLGLCPAAPAEPWPEAYVEKRRLATQYAHQLRTRIIRHLRKALEDAE